MVSFFGKENKDYRNIFDDEAEQLEKGPITVEYPVKPTGLDIEKAKTHFIAYKREIDAMKKDVVEFQVDSDETAAEMTKKATAAKALHDQLEAERKEKIKEPDKFVRGLNAFVKGFRDALSSPKDKSGIVEIAKHKIGQYQFKVELERRKQEAAARQAQKKLQAEMNKEAEAAGVQAPELPPAVLPEKKQPIRTASGSAHMQTEWAYEILDNGKVPLQYLMVNDKAVKAAIKAGIREIPGLEIKEVPKVQFRRG